MKIVCMSDSHNQHESVSVPEADVFIHSGDSTSRGTLREITSFLNWVELLPHKHKIIIAGNHDFGFEDNGHMYKQMCKEKNITYLEDSGITIDGVNFWGSPVQPVFFDWAFNRSINDNQKLKSRKPLIKPHWDMIPVDTDILITHGPPYEILDRTKEGANVGCPVLREALKEKNVKAHIFGHIHEARGIFVTPKTAYINASVLDRKYRLKNKPIALEIDNVTKTIKI
jgi:Icc-related predicted phosphoesterase